VDRARPLLAGLLVSAVSLAAGGGATAQRADLRYYNLYGLDDHQVELRRTDPCNDVVSVPRTHRWHDVPRMLRRSPRAVRRCFGRPPERQPGVWRYRLVAGGCSDFELSVEVLFKRGVVSRVRARWQGTGDFCGNAFDW